jgi:hypothetical protein
VCGCIGRTAVCCWTPYTVLTARLGSVQVFSVKGCGHQHVYHTKFPLDAPAAMKATLTGATLLVDLTTFEQDTTTIG